MAKEEELRRTDARGSALRQTSSGTLSCTQDSGPNLASSCAALPILRRVGTRGRVFGRRTFEAGSSLLVLLWLLLWPSIFLGQVAFDSATSIGQHVAAGTTTVTLPHTTAGSNRVLVVGISMNIANNTGATVSGVSYNGVALTLAGAHNDGGLTRRVEMWYLVAPATGLNNVIAERKSARRNRNSGCRGRRSDIHWGRSNNTDPIISFGRCRRGKPCFAKSPKCLR